MGWIAHDGEQLIRRAPVSNCVQVVSGEFSSLVDQFVDPAGISRADAAPPWLDFLC